MQGDERTVRDDRFSAGRRLTHAGLIALHHLTGGPVKERRPDHLIGAVEGHHHFRRRLVILISHSG
ncbi:hypothetical protein AB0G04_42945 [Actinoplanes sp. NPDC023801]|uniref:hypothetical protein n=1 Tax=Actinoplanes sp. NPDC023801 TaxID=3154595 RepID=UPI0033E1995B